MMPSIMRKQQVHKLLRSNSSMNASCSSDASTDSTQSRASTGRISRRSAPTLGRTKHYGSRVDKVVVVGDHSEQQVCDDVKRRCAWVTPNTDPCYVAFHDEEWGVPVYDDKKLFELLSLSTALAELTWPVILNRRHLFREVFQDFDPINVSKLNEKKIATPGSSASSLLSEVKLRGIIENARHTCKIIKEFGSFNKYIWVFVNHRPTVGQFRYPRQVPIRTSKADMISKDLVRRGFRGVGPTVVYSFMQVAGITNDHLISCFRYQECIAAVDAKDNYEGRADGKLPQDPNDLSLAISIDDLTLSSD
ncbi:hypothetical protein ACET3Z_026766 [Daucus carota]